MPALINVVYEQIEPQQHQKLEDTDATAVLSADPTPINISPPLSGEPGQQLLRLLQEVAPQEGVVASLTMQLHQVAILPRFSFASATDLCVTRSHGFCQNQLLYVATAIMQCSLWCLPTSACYDICKRCCLHVTRVRVAQYCTSSSH